MNEQVKAYLSVYSGAVVQMYERLRQLICESAPCETEEKLWAKLPSYYAGEAFVRLIPFRDHINIEAKAVPLHREELAGYRITPKGMLQIYLGQELPEETLKRIFSETFG